MIRDTEINHCIRPYTRKIGLIESEERGEDFLGTRPVIPNEFTSTYKNVPISSASWELFSRQILFGEKSKYHNGLQKQVFIRRNKRKVGEFGPAYESLKATGEAIRSEVAAIGLTGEKAENMFSELLLETRLNENK